MKTCIMRFRQNVQQSGAKGYITAFSHYSLSVASCGHGIHKQWVPKTIRSTKTWLNNTSARKIKNQNKKHFFFTLILKQKHSDSHPVQDSQTGSGPECCGTH